MPRRDVPIGACNYLKAWGHLSVLKAMHARDPAAFLGRWLGRYAGAAPHPTIVQWLHDIGAGPLPQEFIYEIAKFGNVELLQVPYAASVI
jgi:hypothetical protein